MSSIYSSYTTPFHSHVFTELFRALVELIGCRFAVARPAAAGVVIRRGTKVNMHRCGTAGASMPRKGQEGWEEARGENEDELRVHSNKMGGHTTLEAKTSG